MEGLDGKVFKGFGFRVEFFGVEGFGPEQRGLMSRLEWAYDYSQRL